MNLDARSTGGRDPRTAAIALGATLAIQVFASLVGTAVSVLATEIALDLHVPAKLVGVFVGLIYAGGMAANLVSGHVIERFGPIRVSQVCTLLCSLGIALVAASVAAPESSLLICIVAALVTGVGYAPVTPASSQVLAGTAPVRRMALVFSVKQTGVPGGAALAGALLPALALAVGWRQALVAVAVVGVLLAVAVAPARAVLDAEPRNVTSLSLARVVAPLATLFRSRPLTELAIVGFTYAATQVCLMSFLVVYFAETFGFALAFAGYALTAANIGGIAGRIGWGALADRFAIPRRLLGLLGLASAMLAMVTAVFAATWPAWTLLVACAVFGATAIGWNGIHLSEIARHAPPGRAGALTGACGVVTYAGIVIGPPLFALLTTLTGSYRPGFVLCGVATGMLGSYLLLSKSGQASAH